MNAVPADARGFADYIAREASSKALAAIDAHQRECDQYRRNAQQWQDGATRQFDRMEKGFNDKIDEIKAMFLAHCASDLTYQASLDARMGGWNRFIIGALASLVVTLGGASVTLLIKLLTEH